MHSLFSAFFAIRDKKMQNHAELLKNIYIIVGIKTLGKLGLK